MHHFCSALFTKFTFNGFSQGIFSIQMAYMCDCIVFQQIDVQQTLQNSQEMFI